MLSGRLPRLDERNPWSRARDERRASGAPLLDLTEANPARAGLVPWSAADLAPTAAPAALDYAPDPRGSGAAREAVAAYYASRSIAVDAADVVLVASTSEAYAHLFRLLLDPGERALVPAPSYPLFQPIAQAEGVAVAHYRLEHHGRWTLDLDSLEAGLAAGARAVVLVEPNHPTGSCLSPSERDAALAACAEHGAVVIADEVFGDYPWDPERGSLPSLAGECPVPAFVLSGLSKVCGLPQMKLSWIAVGGPRPARDRARAGLEWLADLFLSVGAPAQLGLPGWLAGRAAFQRPVRARLTANVAAARAACAREPALEWMGGDGGWTGLLRLPARRSGEEWAIAALAEGVCAHPGHFYDTEGEAHLAVSLLVREPDFAAGLARIASLVARG